MRTRSRKRLISRDEEEIAFLEERARDYKDHQSCQERFAREMIVRTFDPYITGGRALEFGCSDGYMTDQLARRFDELNVVDGSAYFIQLASKRKLRNTQLICSLFESFESERTYDHVFATFVLEHVRDAQSVLKKARSCLNKKGLLFVVVPNARSLSRQLALHMGLIEDLYALTENDLRHGHRRAYDRMKLRRDLTTAGFKIVVDGGIFIKPFADFQMDEIIRHKVIGVPQLDGLYSLGQEYPDLSAYLYAICAPK